VFDRRAELVVALGRGVYEVVGQKELSVAFDNLSFVGQGERETIVHGGFVVKNGRKASFEGLTVKDSISSERRLCGLRALGAGTKMVLQNVTVENSQETGVWVDGVWCQARRDGMSISSERRLWGVRAWIHDDRPSHQLHFSPQQVGWCGSTIWCCGGSDGRRNVRA